MYSYSIKGTGRFFLTIKFTRKKVQRTWRRGKGMTGRLPTDLKRHVSAKMCCFFSSIFFLHLKCAFANILVIYPSFLSLNSCFVIVLLLLILYLLILYFIHFVLKSVRFVILFFSPWNLQDIYADLFTPVDLFLPWLRVALV